MSSRFRALAAWSVLLAACGGDPDAPSVSSSPDGGVAARAQRDGGESANPTDRSADPDASASPDAAAVDDEPPVLDAETMAALQGLRYDDGAPPADPSNAFADDPAARLFGQRLFFETALSGRLLSKDNDGSLPTLGMRGEAGRVACASCHVPASGFFDTRSNHRQISLASQWTRRRTPTLLEVAFQPLLNWDGRHDSIWAQAIAVMESAVEFNSGRLFVAEQLFRLHRAEYEAVFGPLPALDDAARFPQLAPLDVGCDEGAGAACLGKPGSADYDAMSADAKTDATRATVNAAKAIAAYVRLLRCGPAPFDAWLDGDATALTPAEQRGAALFVGRGDCVHCHSGPRLTDGAFHNVGLRPATVAVAFTDTGDRGAAEGLALAFDDPLASDGEFSDGDRATLPPAVTSAHEGAFRTPTLRCAALAPSFMHTGQLRTLEQVVAFFDQGGHPAPGYPGTSEIAALGLGEQERADLAAFLRTLTGEGPSPELLRAPDSPFDASASADPPKHYPDGPPGCGLAAAAFCDTFDDVAASGLGEGRAGELDPRSWSGARMQPGLNFGESATPVRAATIPSCRADLPQRVYPGQDALVCEGNERIQSRHLMMAAAEQSYGQLSLRARRPFDFKDRTGTVVFDAEGELQGFLQGWVSLAITAEPTPAPSFGVQQNFENGAVPRNGVEVHLYQLCGAEDKVGVAQVDVFRDFVETFYVDDAGGRSPTCVLTERGALNHFELRISRSHLEVWGSDRSLDGLHFGELTRLFALDVELPFDRGYVHINTHNHSSLKYSDNMVDAWVARWDNVGFDGPVIGGLREYSVADALQPVTIDGVECRNVGYQLGDVAEGPRQTLAFHGVDPSSVASAVIALDGHFNTHTDVPFTDYALRYRVNAGGWRERRFDTAQLALLSGPVVLDESGTNTRGDGSGIAGAMALVLDVEPASLVAGDNTLEFVTSGVPNSYRPYVANVDLVLATQ